METMEYGIKGIAKGIKKGDKVFKLSVYDCSELCDYKMVVREITIEAAGKKVIRATHSENGSFIKSNIYSDRFLFSTQEEAIKAAAAFVVAAEHDKARRIDCKMAAYEMVLSKFRPGLKAEIEALEAHTCIVEVYIQGEGFDKSAAPVAVYGGEVAPEADPAPVATENAPEAPAAIVEAGTVENAPKAAEFLGEKRTAEAADSARRAAYCGTFWESRDGATYAAPSGRAMEIFGFKPSLTPLAPGDLLVHIGSGEVCKLRVIMDVRKVLVSWDNGAPELWEDGMAHYLAEFRPAMESEAAGFRSLAIDSMRLDLMRAKRQEEEALQALEDLRREGAPVCSCCGNPQDSNDFKRAKCLHAIKMEAYKLAVDNLITAMVK